MPEADPALAGGGVTGLATAATGRPEWAAMEFLPRRDDGGSR